MPFFGRWGSFRKSEQNSINFYIVNENKNKSKSEKSYNNPLIKETMKKLYEDRNETGDVSFHVGSEVVRAHRSILSVHSPKFRVQFFGQNPDTGDIEVNDVSAAAFKEFLQFFYLENVSLSMENMEDVLNLAKQSGVKEFMDQCVDFLFQIMTMDEIIWTYQLGIRCGIEKIRNFCEPLVSIHIKDLLVSDHFIQCAHQTFGEILKSDTLACRESELFDACISWAKAACKNSGEDATNSNLRSKLGSAITQIRFGSMTADEFLCRHKLYKELFSPDESNEILYMIGKVDGVEPTFFNPTPRNQFEYHPLTERQPNLIVRPNRLLICDRTMSPSAQPSTFNTIAYIGFSCNADVVVEKFVLSLSSLIDRFIPNEVRANILTDGLLSDQTAKVYKKSNVELVVSFIKHIEIRPNIEYDISLVLPELKGCLSTHDLEKNMDIENICFKFNTNATKKDVFVSRLYFHRPN